MNTKKYLQHEILLEILMLRDTNDSDVLLDKIYEAISGEFRGTFDSASITQDQRIAFSVMIEHFKKKEEFEKCAVLKMMTTGVTRFYET